MLHFFKVLLRGIVTTVLLPVILLVWAVYAAYCLVAFIVMLIKSLIVFFAGDSASGEMKEDIEAKRILLEKEQTLIDTNSMLSTLFVGNQMQQQTGVPYPPQQQSQQQRTPGYNFPMYGGDMTPTNNMNLNDPVYNNVNPQTQQQPNSEIVQNQENSGDLPLENENSSDNFANNIEDTNDGNAH